MACGRVLIGDRGNTIEMKRLKSILILAPHAAGKPRPSLLLLAILLAGFCVGDGAEATGRKVRLVARGDRGMVVSVRPEASRIGRDVLRCGGNAVDAAVATAFALAVCWPEAGNLGGGGFMMIHPGEAGPPMCIDYRETAPAAATATMFSPNDGRHTHKIVGVPGTVRGLALAHQSYGKLPWKRLVAPSVQLARQGLVVDSLLAASLNGVLDSQDVESDLPRFAELRRVYGHPRRPAWQAGDRLVQPDLSATLSRIAEQGADAFYTGHIADQIVAEMQSGNGLITKKDLAAYRAKMRKPIHGTYRDHEVFGPPPPSSGGICLVEALNMLEALQLDRQDRFSSRNMHLIAEVMRRAFCDRARHLGDADYVAIPQHLTSKAYAQELARQIDPAKVTGSEQLARDIPLANESPQTTHFSVIDASGMAVSNTYTLEASWGARIVVRGAGFLLNNEMGDFNWIPGHTDRQGRIGTAANQIAPGKRMLSSQTPVIVARNGKVLLVTGSPGGRSIINTVLAIVLNVLEFEMDLPAAVAAPRMHHQWFPDCLYFEAADQTGYQDAVEQLRRMGHDVQARRQGSAHSIWVHPQSGWLWGVADRRRGGLAAGLSPQVLCRWDFDEPPRTRLQQTHNDGSLPTRWRGNLADSSTDGQGAYRVRCDARGEPADACADLTRRGEAAQQLWCVARIHSFRLVGQPDKETLRFDFLTDGDEPSLAASMVLRRQGEGRVELAGEAPRGGTAIAARTIVRSNRLDQPLRLVLQLDNARNRYQIFYRRESVADAAYRSIGGGQLDPRRRARRIRLRAVNDFSSEDELLDLDWVEITTARPMRLPRPPDPQLQ